MGNLAAGTLINDVSNVKSCSYFEVLLASHMANTRKEKKVSSKIFGCENNFTIVFMKRFQGLLYKICGYRIIWQPIYKIK